MERLTPTVIGLLAALSLLSAGCASASPTATPAPTPTPPPEPPHEREALSSFYRATNGPGWVDNSNWLTGAPLADWYGVGVDGAGRVTELNLVGNELSGSLAPELSNLTHLTELRLGGNRLSGQIPPQLGQLAHLEILQLRSNMLSGTIPAELAYLEQLRVLALGHNRLNGHIPPQLGRLANLERLLLPGNLLDGGVPAELGELSKLTMLTLEWNQLSGDIPPELGDLAELSILRLAANRLSGLIPPQLADLANLTELTLDWNQLTGEIPPGLVELPNLTDLRLDGNQLSGDLALELQRELPVRVGAETVSASVAPPPRIRLEPAFAGRRFTRPNELGAYPTGIDGEPGPGLFVASQEGVLLLLEPDDRVAVELLDISDRVSGVTAVNGLLSAALDPRFDETGHIWLYYTAVSVPIVNRLSRFAADLSDPTRIDPGSELIVLEIEAGSHHHGGAIRFGPDGMLYLGVGDAELPNVSRRLDSLYGSIIRIDVRSSSAASPYLVPPDNPFVDQQLARPEIWAYGLRNPWRMAFDPATGVLWAGDVGVSELEEIDHIVAGGNYGWNRFEGTKCVDPAAGCSLEGLTLPVVEYSHEAGCVVVGGVVYRGRALPALTGHYLFSDYCEGWLWALPPDGGDVIELGRISRPVVSFGLDDAGEVYVLTRDGAILRIVAP